MLEFNMLCAYCETWLTIFIPIDTEELRMKCSCNTKVVAVVKQRLLPLVLDNRDTVVLQESLVEDV